APEKDRHTVELGARERFAEALGDLGADAGDEGEAQTPRGDRRGQAGQELVGELGLRARATDGEGEERRAIVLGHPAEASLDLAAVGADEPLLGIEAREPAGEVLAERRAVAAADELVGE